MMQYRGNTFYSFTDIDWNSFHDNIISTIDKEICDCTDDYLLNVNENDYVSYLLEKFTLEPITIHRDSEEVEQPIEFKEDISQYGNYSTVYERYRNGYIIQISYSYEGNGNLFKVRPNSFTLTSYKISLDEYSSRVSFEIKVYSQDVDEFNKEKEYAYNCAFANVKNINSCVASFNIRLAEVIRQRFLSAKKNRLEKTNFFAAIKVKKLTNAPTTYGVPIVRKKTIIKPSCQKTKAYSPEPSLDIATYENIIAELNQVGISMERKPSLYLNKDEEGLRDVFLTMLETRFEGTTATGETFNHCGKTDILLRNSADESNLFIAECKFWHGPKHFKDAISQLFDRYLTWRDSKTALIVFVNGTNFTTVLRSIKESVVSHPYYIRSNGEHGKTSYSYIFQLPHDAQKEVYLEVMAFNFDKNKTVE